jgi:cytochrome b pre-mRNA-processing protein 3
MPFSALRRFSDHRRRDKIAAMLYRALVGQARQPAFYSTLGVPDTLEGRYDLLILQAYLLLRRLGQIRDRDAEEARGVSQATFDLMFADMDQNLRELGVTDTGIGKRVRRMAEAFYGRVSAYDKAQEVGGTALADALARNLYRTAPPLPEHLAAMEAYVNAQQAALARQGDADLLAGRISFLLPQGISR